MLGLISSSPRYTAGPTHFSPEMHKTWNGGGEVTIGGVDYRECAQLHDSMFNVQPRTRKYVHGSTTQVDV
jgi:hypothetical protein